MKYQRSLLLALLGCALVAANANADPIAEYNRMRAQRLFANSRAPVKTWSSLSSGFVRPIETPTEYGYEWQGPTYQQRRISPRGYERYIGPTERVIRVVPRPIVVVPPRSNPVRPPQPPVVPPPQEYEPPVP